jgi:hypothetical protein
VAEPVPRARVPDRGLSVEIDPEVLVEIDRNTGVQVREDASPELVNAHPHDIFGVFRRLLRLLGGSFASVPPPLRVVVSTVSSVCIRLANSELGDVLDGESPKRYIRTFRALRKPTEPSPFSMN